MFFIKISSFVPLKFEVLIKMTTFNAEVHDF